MCVRKELQHAAVDNSTFCAKVCASARFLRLALESRSLQRCTRARFISCEYACFLLRYLCVGGCRGSLSLCRLAIQTGSFLFPSLPQPLTVTLNFQADASQSLCIPEGLRLCTSVSHFWNPSLLHLDLRTNTLGLCGTWIPWRWESLKYHHCFPRHCSESTALTMSESISAGSGPACINLNHPHPAKSLNSDWGRFLPGTTQPVPVKLHQGWIWLGTQGDRPPIHPSTGAAEILRSTLQRTIDVKWRRPSASSLSLKCCY